MAGQLTKKTLMLSACALALTLGACSGGGGGGVTPIPAAPSAPPPPPPPPPPPSPAPGVTSVNYNDSEYQRSNGAVTHKALSAYTAGGTGRGVKIGIVDSGINPSLAEFQGRIDAASQDVAGAGRGVVDKEGHGTAVAGVAAAGRNGTGSLGIAFDATIIALNSSNPNNCDEETGCTHSDSAIARGIDVARVNGAKVINISLGGDGVGSAVLNAIAKASAAGIVVVISAGNEAEANPSVFASSIAKNAGNGLVIIAGASDAAGNMASFSNLAGSSSQFFLTAIGDKVRTVDENGTATLWSGTSFSAPVISGAAALLASAFPNLTGAQIVQLLLSTADDAGAAGRDSRYGHGILNIQRAFEPQGQTMLAGTTSPVSTTDNGQASPTMGDATGEMAGAVIFDGYGRAYALDLARTIGRAVQEMPLTQAFHANMRSAGVVAGKTAVSITIDRTRLGEPEVGVGQMGMTYDDSRQAKVIAGLALSRIAPNTAVALGFSQSGEALKQQLVGQEANAFLVARNPMERTGFYGEDRTSFGVRQKVGSVGLTVTSEEGEVYDPNVRADMEGPRYTMGSVSLDRSFGPAKVTLGMTRLAERQTLLGARFSSAFTSGGATSYFLDGNASFDLGRGWGANASYRRGWTNMAALGTLVTDGGLSTDAWALDLSKRNAFSFGDVLAFRLMQPLRVRSGGFNMNVPVSFDYSTQSIGYENRLLSLSPSGREIDLEAAYGVGLWGGHVSANAFLRHQPGHIAAADNDIGAAVRFSLGF